MKAKYLVFIGLLLALTMVLSGCASGLTASAWPAMTADAKYAYLAGGSYVYAVDLQTGAQVWRFPDKASANPFDAAPVLTSDGQLIVGGFDKKLYSLNPQTGLSTWQFTGAHDRWIGGALVVNDMIYAPNADYNLYAINLRGELQWTFEADQAIWGVPISDGTNIYFGTLGRKVYAVNAQTGKQVWVKKVDGAVLGSPVIGTDQTLYVDSYGGTVYALSTANGVVRWSAAASSWIWSGPALDGTTLYFGDGNGSLYAHPVGGTGQPWNKPLNGAIIGTPLVSGDNIIVGTEAGNVYFIDHTGTNLRPISISGKVYSSPVAAGSLILVAPTGGNSTLIALDPTGAVKWSFIPPK
ncbi:MAG: PQQ-binding-like beta-propeller repeat protein [Anaerolineales bacterium]|jgi:outer membrane protein assembly factor BamB